MSDLPNISKKSKWNFDWKVEFNDLTREVYKLTIVNNPDIIQGLLSVTIEKDHVFMNLLENSPFNLGKNKLYEGVAGNLVAYACKLSFQNGFDGFVAFTAKTDLVKHYEKTLGAYHFKNQLMILDTEASSQRVKNTLKRNRMGHINEPKGIDFLIQSPPLTEKERIELSEFIKKRKLASTQDSNNQRKVKIKSKTKA